MSRCHAPDTRVLLFFAFSRVKVGRAPGLACESSPRKALLIPVSMGANLSNTLRCDASVGRRSR